MNRIMIVLWSLGISFSAAGCALEEHEPIEVTYDDSITAEGGDERWTLENGESPLSDADSRAGLAEAFVDESFGTEGCWVTLEWCVDPITGSPTCSASGTTCTIHQIEYHCGVLIRQYC